MSDFVLSALSTCPLSIAESSPAERLERFGKFLTFLGTLADDDFHEWAQSAVLARAAGLGQAAEAALKRDRCYPDYWAEDLSQIMERISRAVLEPGYVVPDEVKNRGGLFAAKEVLREFGELVRWWPAIVERAKVLAESGTWVGCRLGDS